MAAESSLYGCHNHPPYKTQRWIQDGWETVSSLLADGHVRRVARFVHITVEAPTECEYTKSENAAADPRCAGCNYRR